MTLHAFYDSLKLFQLNFTVTESLRSLSESMAIAINYYNLNPFPRFIVAHSPHSSVTANRFLTVHHKKEFNTRSAQWGGGERKFISRCERLIKIALKAEKHFVCRWKLQFSFLTFADAYEVPAQASKSFIISFSSPQVPQMN